MVLKGSKMSEKNFNIPGEDINKIVHEPARLKILIYLSLVENCDFVYLMYQTKLSKGNLSSHLSKLESAGYVSINKEFVEKIPRTLMTITDNGRQALMRYKKNIMVLLETIE